MPEVDDPTIAKENPPPKNEAGLYTIPNLLSLLRLLGAPVCIALAHLNQPTWFFVVMAFMIMSDWVDGKIAIWFNLRSTFGARLDSTADAMMYAAVLYGMWWLKWPMVREEAPWIVMALVSYVVTSAAGLWKFGRWPSYHTRAAKTSWFLMGLAILAVFADFSRWPLRIAMIAVTLTNIEATLITCILPAWVTDLPSLWHAFRLKKQLQRQTKL